MSVKDLHILPKSSDDRSYLSVSRTGESSPRMWENFLI